MEDMNELVVEKVNAGILYLYGAVSRKEFYGRLKALLGALFRKLSFSVLIPSEREGAFYVDYSSEPGTSDLDRPMVESLELLEAFKARRGRSFAPEQLPVLTWKGIHLPVAEVKVIVGGGVAKGLMVVHGSEGPGPADELGALEEHVFDHVFAAFEQVREKDSLLERLEESNARMEAIREIGSLLGQLELATLLSHLMAVCIRLTDAQVGAIALEGSLADYVEWGLPRSVLERIGKRGEPCSYKIARETQQPILLRGYQEDPTFEPVSDCRIDSVLCVPLVSKERVLGTVNLINGSASQGGMFSEKDKITIVTISSLAATAIENAVLHRESIEKERLKAGLQIARTIQRGMYPVKAPGVDGYDIAWITRSSEETGGDYFDFLSLDPGRLVLAVGDVSGHGIGAALLMAAGRANLRALLSVKQDLKEVMGRLNDLLVQDMDSERFMTLFLGSLDTREHSLAFVSAGHDPPLFYSRSRRQVVALRSTGIPLGMMPKWDYERGLEQRMDCGDILLLTTDGVWEATSQSGERFGRERVMEALTDTAEGPAREIVEAILSRLEAHMGGADPQDDMTLVVLKRLSAPECGLPPATIESP
jgi:sigma-B regulation protein RsbU (phosphoserine phosphatase)